MNMDLQTLANLATIVSLVVAIFSWLKSNKVEKIVKQKISGDNNIQAGRDLNVK